MKEKYYKEQNNSWFWKSQQDEVLLPPNPNISECIEISKEEYEALEEIQSLKAQLLKTDYIVIKISETIDDEEKIALRNEYKNILEQRKQARIRINQLEQILS